MLLVRFLMFFTVSVLAVQYHAGFRPRLDSLGWTLLVGIALLCTAGSRLIEWGAAPKTDVPANKSRGLLVSGVSLLSMFVASWFLTAMMA